MADHASTDPVELPPGARQYLGDRLDGARDLYLVALALGERGLGASMFGHMIREARIHFASVIEEARVAGLDAGAISGMLSQHDMGPSIRPELRDRVQELLNEARPRRAAAEH
jgi:hypothetical protein